MLLKLKKVSFVYMKDTPFERKALKSVDLAVKKGDFIGLIGATGSGKSTLAQIMAGLLFPTGGEVFFGGKKVGSKISPSFLTQKVGLIMQNPEDQLFAETVFDDVAFGPRNIGCSEDEVKRRVKEALELVGLNFELFKDRSPFELSGGEMRRVAIAGVLALKPEILILDEPTSGLDARGKEEILSYIRRLREEKEETIIFISHDMDEIAELAHKIVVLKGGKIIFDDLPKKVFTCFRELEETGLDVPEVTKVLVSLSERGFNVRRDVLNLEGAKEAVMEELKRRKVKLRGKKTNSF